jgi:hypothetical protein
MCGHEEEGDGAKQWGMSSLVLGRLLRGGGSGAIGLVCMRGREEEGDGAEQRGTRSLVLVRLLRGRVNQLECD